MGQRSRNGRLSLVRSGRLPGRKDQADQGDANQKPENEGGRVADRHRMMMPRSLVMEHIGRLQSAGKSDRRTTCLDKSCTALRFARNFVAEGCC